MSEFPTKQWSLAGLNRLLRKIDATGSAERRPGQGRKRSVNSGQTLWPPNSLDLNPVDYKLWSVIQEQVYKVKVNNADELRQRIQTVWDELDQRVIDKAFKQWCTRLRACVKAKGGHFEHKLQHFVKRDRLYKCLKFY